MMILPFHALTPGQLAQVLAIYRQAFDAPWEWPAEKIAQLASSAADADWHTAALLTGDAVVALAVAKYFAATNLWYLHYLAVDATRRGQGAGSRLLANVLQAGEARARAAGQPGCRGTLLEVETVDAPPLAADRHEREQRLAFYRRFGALSTNVLFPRPPDAPPEQPDWDIQFIPGAAWAGELDAATRREFCRALLVEGYDNPPDAAWLLAYLDGIT